MKLIHKKPRAKDAWQKQGRDIQTTDVVRYRLQSRQECVTNEKESSFQCCIKDEGGPLMYALREEYINYFMVL